MDSDDKQPLLSAPPSGPPRWQLGLLLLCIAGQNASYTLVRGFSRGALHQQYCLLTAQLASELLKLLFCLLAVDDVRSACKGSLWKTAVVSVTYLTQNLLSLFALGLIQPSVFSLVSQLKLLSTATCGLAVGKTQSARRWMSLCVVTTGVMLAAGTTVSSSAQPIAYIGVGAALVEVLLAGAASVAFELVLKQEAEVGVLARNVQLSSMTVAIAAPALFWEDAPFDGWTTLASVSVVLGAVGGLLVALSLRYCDAVSKALATCLSLVITTIVTFAINLRADLISVVGCVLVCIGIVQYALD